MPYYKLSPKEVADALITEIERGRTAYKILNEVYVYSKRDVDHVKIDIEIWEKIQNFFVGDEDK